MPGEGARTATAGATGHSAEMTAWRYPERSPDYAPALVLIRAPSRDTRETPDGPRRRRARPLVDGFAAVSEIDVRASAGPGAINDGIEEARATWLFPEAIVRHEFRADTQPLTTSSPPRSRGR